MAAFQSWQLAQVARKRKFDNASPLGTPLARSSWRIVSGPVGTPQGGWLRAAGQAFSLVTAIALMVPPGVMGVQAGEAKPAHSIAQPSNSPETSSAAFTGNLPANVIEMRDAILAAARSGDIGELVVPYEWNELPPILSEDNVDDPIIYLKSLSSDGEGLEILAQLADLLSLPPAKLHLGRDAENSGVFVWPYLSERQLKALSGSEKVDLFSIMPAENAKAILETGKWNWWRLTIGADGTWHSFMKHPH